MKNSKLRLITLAGFFLVFTANIGNVAATKANSSNDSNTLINGKPAPDFTLKDIEGNSVSIKDFEGKVVYLDIWASWCAPCIIQMKKAETLKAHFKNNDDLVFLYLSIDSDENKWKDAVSKRSIKGVHLLSKDGKDSDIKSKFALSSIPRYVLIDKNGNIVDNQAKNPSSSGIIKDIEKLL